MKKWNEDDARLACSYDELIALEQFLKPIGIRVRYLMAYTDEALSERVYIVEAENPYKAWIGENERKIADVLMTEDAIKRYQE